LSVCVTSLSYRWRIYSKCIDYSAQEYFRHHEDLFPNARKQIAESCLTYLSFEPFTDGHCESNEQLKIRLEQNPFLQYAAPYWGCHALGDSEIELSERILKFLTQEPQLSCAMQVLLLLRNQHEGARPDAHKAYPALCVAAYFGLLHIAKALMHSGAEVDSRTASRETALQCAAGNGHLEMVRLLIDHEAVVNAEDQDGATALHLASDSGHVEVVRHLLGNGAKTEIHITKYEDWSDKTTGTALHYAAIAGHERVAEALLDGGADIESCNEWNRTPLHLAARYGHLGVVKLLINRGANLEAPRDGYETPLHFAVEENRYEVVKMLLESCANLGADAFKGTPLDIAIAFDHTRLIDLLQSKGAQRGKAAKAQIDDNRATGPTRTFVNRSGKVGVFPPPRHDLF